VDAAGAALSKPASRVANPEGWATAAIWAADGGPAAAATAETARACILIP